MDFAVDFDQKLKGRQFKTILGDHGLVVSVDERYLHLRKTGQVGTERYTLSALITYLGQPVRIELLPPLTTEDAQLVSEHVRKLDAQLKPQVPEPVILDEVKHDPYDEYLNQCYRDGDFTGGV